jgi:MHS family alpha-ketoglutarate permease-like MFS transporter
MLSGPLDAIASARAGARDRRPHRRPTRLRTSGIGVPYAICAAIFGGTAPLIAVKYPESIAFYVMGIALVSFITFLFMPETRGKPLD